MRRKEEKIVLVASEKDCGGCNQDISFWGVAALPMWVIMHFFVFKDIKFEIVLEGIMGP